MRLVIKILKVLSVVTIICIIFLASVIFFDSSRFEYNWDSATYDSENVTITMLVYPMFGIHSDWHRKLKISTHQDTLEVDLFEDTGWWRGSNLYLHTSGAYVLVEGQTGCTAFSSESLTFVNVTEEIDCFGNKADEIVSHDNSGPPISKYYSDMIYLGRFYEKNGVGFSNYYDQEERQLPKPL